MKKIKYVYIIFGLFFISLVSSISMFSKSCNGWGNGGYTCGNLPVQDPTCYNVFSNYGTHDWIAESALEILHYKNPGHKFIQDLHSNQMNLEKYFLFGTEIPDLLAAYTRLTFTLYTTCGTFSSTEVDRRSSHTLRYSGLNLVPGHMNLWYAAQSTAQSISYAFKERDCQKAAFFLGVLCHWIGDAAYYAHLIDNNIPDQSYGVKVNHVTNTPYSTLKRLNEFFNIAQAYDRFTLDTIHTPDMATYYAGLDVRYGNYYQRSFTTTQYKNAEWLDDNAPITDTNFAYWDVNSEVQNWDADDRPTSPQDRKDYFDTVEHNLNVAVYYCASAINYLIKDYSGCGCDGPKQTIQKTMRKWSSTYLLLFSWLSLGTMAFLMSLGVSKFMEICVTL